MYFISNNSKAAQFSAFIIYCVALRRSSASRASTATKMVYGLNTSLVYLIMVLLVASHTYIQETSASGECGNIPITSVAADLSPCVGVTETANTKVPPACCKRVASLLKSSPSCQCAVLLSPLVKHSGINPAVAMTIPKRCNIKNRPTGKKCGRYAFA